MNPESTLRPCGNTDPDRSGPSPHLSDYWQVVSLRLWLVLLVFGVTTASAIWTVSRQRIYYQSHLSLHVNDPAQPARGLVTPGHISGLDIFVDPIESEIQVLRSTPIAAAVVDPLGLRLRPASEDRVRSDLFRDVRVEQGTPEGRLELVYDAAGKRAQLRAPDGTVLATAETGTRIEAPFLAFHLKPPPDESRVYPLDLLPTSVVVAEITGNLSAATRANTNLIDAYFLSSDPVIVPRVLNAIAAGTCGHGRRHTGRAHGRSCTGTALRRDRAAASRTLGRATAPLECTCLRRCAERGIGDHRGRGLLSAVLLSVSAHRRGRGEVGKATRWPVSSVLLIPVAVTALPDHPHGTTL